MPPQDRLPSDVESHANKRKGILHGGLHNPTFRIGVPDQAAKSATPGDYRNWLVAQNRSVFKYLSRHSSCLICSYFVTLFFSRKQLLTVFALHVGLFHALVLCTTDHPEESEVCAPMIAKPTCNFRRRIKTSFTPVLNEVLLAEARLGVRGASQSLTVLHLVPSARNSSYTCRRREVSTLEPDGPFV